MSDVNRTNLKHDRYPLKINTRSVKSQIAECGNMVYGQTVADCGLRTIVLPVLF